MNLQRRILGVEHVHTLSSMRTLAEVFYEKLGRPDEAEPLLLEVLETLRRVHGDGYSATVQAVQDLGLFYRHEDRNDEAERYMLEALELRRRETVAAGAPLDARFRYAWLLLNCDPVEPRPDEALPIALEVNRATGFERPDYLDTLARAYYLTGDVARAIEYQKKAISLMPDVPHRAGFEDRLRELEAIQKAASAGRTNPAGRH